VLEEFLARTDNQRFALSLRAKTAQEISNELIDYLAQDLRASCASYLHRAVSIVLFFDTFEAVSSEAHNEEHKREYEQWIRDVAANFDFALTVIAGQNRLSWDEIDPNWAEHLDQHLVGGLSEKDARAFLSDCGIDSETLQDVVLATALEADGGHHCFSLGLCADIIVAEQNRGIDTSPESLKYTPQDWECLARRFLKSLASDGEVRWIERLATSLRFDEPAARAAFSEAHSAAQDAAWASLPKFSFIEHMTEQAGWLNIREQMRWAIENQPSRKQRLAEDHVWWQKLWTQRSQCPVDIFAELAWYHQYHSQPVEAFRHWKQLAEDARTALPPRMKEHFSLLGWWSPVKILTGTSVSEFQASASFDLGLELYFASIGSRSHNLRRAMDYYYATLRVITEQEFPQDWAGTQNNLGEAWRVLPTGDRGENLRRAIECYQAALRIFTEQEFSQYWAMAQANLGLAWSVMPTGSHDENLRRAIDYYHAALRVFSDQEYPHDWAGAQKNLGDAWSHMPTGDRGENLRRAIDYYHAALRVFSEEKYPRDWAGTQNSLGIAWSDMPTGDRGENLRHAIDCYQASLQICTKQEFPQEWAGTQHNLGIAWYYLPTGDRGENLRSAIDCYQAALQVYTEQEFPQSWKRTQANLGDAWRDMPTGDLRGNFQRAINCYEAALRIFAASIYPTEHDELDRRIKEARDAVDKLNS
jgi:tetratricopeptide (TPR) repeat protein